MVGRRLLECPQGDFLSPSFILPGMCHNCPDYIRRGRPARCLQSFKATWDAKTTAQPRRNTGSLCLSADCVRKVLVDIEGKVTEADTAVGNAITSAAKHFKTSMDGFLQGDILKLLRHAEKVLVENMKQLLKDCGDGDLLRLLNGSMCIIGNPKTGCAFIEKGADNTPFWVSEIMELEVSLTQQLCA